MKTIFKETTGIISRFFKVQRYRSTALMLAVCMMFSMIPSFAITAVAEGTGTFQANQAENKGNYAVLNWPGTPGSKFAVEKSNSTDNIYETIPLKYSINVLNVYPNTGNNLKSWMQSNNTGSPIINGTKYTMTVDEVPITTFNSSPSTYLGTAGNWKYDVIYFGGYDANNNYDISLTARNLLEQFIKSGGGVLLGHDTAAFNYTNFKYIASTYLNLQATEATLQSTSPDFIPTYGNTKVNVARKGLLTNYPYTLGDVGTVMTVPESHSYHEFASGNIWFSYNGTNGNWDTSSPEMTTYKGKTGTNNFYLTTLNNVAMIQAGHSGGTATIDEQKILTNTLYYLAQTTNQTTFDDHSAQDLTAPSKVSGPVTVSGSSISFTESVDTGNDYKYKLYTVDDVNGTKTDTGETATATVTTGLKGYSYVINQSVAPIDVDTTVEATTASIDVSSLTVGNYYLHIRAIDNAGNASDESVLPFTIKPTQPAGKVILNKPVLNNDKSGYSFKSATINNLAGVHSITFSTTKGTTVKTVPIFLNPSSKLESINGDAKTFVYTFDNGITVSQAEEFIRGIVFNYMAGTEVSITVDNNVNKLPDGAKITKYAHPDGKDHYYMYVPSNFISWTDAYNKAKSYTYKGLKGYLATITSHEEDGVLENISTISAWSAGTRYLNEDNSKLTDPISVSESSKTANYYYWACGPEAGTIYYNSTSPTSAPGAGYTGYNGAYNNWGANPKQPDANTSNETCMQVNWPLDKDSNGKMRWNDLPNGGWPIDDLVKGYFVEFSNYAGGLESTYSSDKTAVGKYNLTTDGGVEEGATVTLNAPVYGSGNKSEFSFSSAEIKNISTITSLTIKLDNYTNVMSKPASPVPTKELSNIAGTTNTITYLFGDGITQADAQSFLTGLKFRYGGLKASSTTNVSVTVDGNKTNLPTGASITEFNGHYYMYVNDYLSWTNAYNKAKTYSYMGMIGYLATITSAEEDKMLDNISMNGAWSAGTRYTGAYDTNTAPGGALDNYFKWACGPEAGTNYYCFNSTSSKYPVSGAYNGFVDAGEPNGWYNPADGKTECCMQVHYKGASGNSSSAWNDLRDIIYSGSYNGSGYEPKVGYFVEFSDYNGGRVEGYTQSANGKSAVPISVEKGDVFNKVKDGGIYYVDTKLTAFDRNITKITVNNSAFTNCNILAGNKNTTYTIVATDLEGNTATMAVTMKTIASISDSIKSLTVSNVQMSNKDSILAVKTALMAIDQTDASDVQKNEIANAIQNCKNLYFALFNATSTATNGTNGWYKNGIGDIMLTAPDGFQISTSNSGAWSSSITVDKADSANKTAAYYLKEISTGDISSTKTFSYKVDTAAPTGTINIKSNTFKNFINTISFGMFFKNNVDVSISASDNLSTSVAISYQKTKEGEGYSESGTWVDGSSFSVTANEKFSIYAKLTDNAGNKNIINSDGVVVYTDSTKSTTDISFTKTGITDVTAKVNLNGNTVKEIKNGANLIASTNYSVATDGTITFKASYIDSLAVGTYTFTISYNPMGESYVTGTSIGDAPLTTTLSLAVKAKDMSDKGGVSVANVTVTPDSCTYTGSTFAPAVTIKDGTKTLVKDSDYTLSWDADMTSAGEKTLTITFIGNYSGIVTKKVAIVSAVIVDTTSKTQSTAYNKNAQSVSAPKGTTVNSQVLTVKYSIDGKNYDLNYAPTFTVAGNYTVYYQLSAPNHNTVTGEIAFKINAAGDNSITDLSLNSWTFGEKANVPTATAKYGTISYTYSDSENGTYTNTVPTQAGTYYVKASVAATGDYNGCEAKKSFTISVKTIADKDIAISGIDEYYIFTNSEIKPEPTVNVGGIVLKKAMDYTVGYENNTQIGKNAKVIVTLKGDYSGAAEKTFEIRYGKMSDTEVKNAITLPDFNSNGWYNKDITIAAKDGWMICKTPIGAFGKSLTISDESGNTGTDYTFYIKKADGSVYERTLNYKLDKTAPTNAKITIKDKEFTSLLNKITFGIFFKETVNVTITADGNISGIKTIEYQKVAKDTDYNPSGTWVSGSSFNVNPDDKFIVYARVTDNAGNYVVVNSDGVIVDSTNPDLALTPDVSDWTSKDVNVKVEASDKLAGVKEVTYTTDEKVPQSGTVAISEGKGTIKLSNEGQYKLTVTAKDNSGNEVSQKLDIKIDRTLPKFTGAADISSYFIGRVIKLTDDLGEIASATYKKDAADEISFSNEALFDKPGKYALTLKDKAGNEAKLSFEIKAMPKVEEVIYTADSKALIDSIRAEFNSHSDLPEPYKTNTDNEIKTLEARYAKLHKEVMDIKAETSAIKGKVDALPKGVDGLISLKKEIQGEYAKIAGNASTLTKEQKLALEKEAEYLKQQLDIITQLESQIDAVRTKVSSIDTKLDGLISKEGSIKEILTDVDKLTKEQKNILQPQIDTLKGLVDKINILKEEVETVKGMISKLPSAAKVTKENLEQLISVEKAYNKLTNEQKSLVGDYNVKWLKDCLDALRKLMLHNEENDLTVTGIEGTSFDSEVYLVVTQIKNDSASTTAKFAVSVESIKKAAETTSEIRNKELVALYDVSLFKDNVKVQPDGKVKVKIKIPEALKGRTGLDIVHIADDGTVTPMHAVVEDGYLLFITTHFSDYAIVAVPVASTTANTATTINTTSIPKTGSPVDLNSLVALGTLLILTGVVVIRRQRRKA